MRSSMYEDIRTLLRPGFLAHPVTVNGCAMSMRTLSQDDLLLLNHRSENPYSKEWQNWAIATSIWMIEGQVTIGDPNVQYLIYERLGNLPRMFREDMFSIFTGLMNRVERALRRAEAFLYEEESRYLWLSEGNEMLKRPPFFGAPVLGLNELQKTWVAYNRYEDKRGERKYWWGLSKFIVQPHAPKGITKLNNSEKKQDEEEEERRQRVMDVAYWKSQGAQLDKATEKALLRNPKALFQSETVEDLHTEMANWVAGKKDFHDNAVDFVKAKIKGEVEGRRAAERDRIAAIQHEFEEDGIIEPAFAPLMGEAAEAASRRMLSPKTPSKVYQKSERHNTAYEKYIRHNPDVGTLEVDEQGNINSSSRVAVSPEQLLEMLMAPEDEPGTGSKPDLQQRVSQRAAEQRGKT